METESDNFKPELDTLSESPAPLSLADIVHLVHTLWGKGLTLVSLFIEYEPNFKINKKLPANVLHFDRKIGKMVFTDAEIHV